MTETTLPRLEEYTDCLPCWERLDRVGWTAGLSFACHGARIGIRVNDPALLACLPDRLPPGGEVIGEPLVDELYSLAVGGPSPRADVRRYTTLYHGVGRLARTKDLDEALETLEHDLHARVAEQARERLFVHAGVVGWRGRALLIPGRSFSGKTSLVAALVRAGATYYSDEYAVLDPDGLVHPYAKRLSLRDGTGETPRLLLVEELGGHAGTAPLPVGLVAVTDYHAGARWRPRALTPGQALLALLDNTVVARLRPAFALPTLQRALTGARAVKGRRGEADAVAAALLSAGEQSPGPRSRGTEVSAARPLQLPVIGGQRASDLYRPKTY